MNSRRPRVFVTQESQQLNYTPAEEFGEVVFLTNKEPSPVPGSLINESIQDEIDHKLQSFEPSVDWVAPSGSPVVAAMVFLTLGQKCGGVMGYRMIKLLRWSNRDHRYQPMTLKVA